MTPKSKTNISFQFPKCCLKVHHEMILITRSESFFHIVLIQNELSDCYRTCNKLFFVDTYMHILNPPHIVTQRVNMESPKMSSKVERIWAQYGGESKHLKCISVKYVCALKNFCYRMFVGIISCIFMPATSYIAYCRIRNLHKKNFPFLLHHVGVGGTRGLKSCLKKVHVVCTTYILCVCVRARI